MPPAPSGSISIDQGSGPFHYGDVLTFTFTTSHLRGGHPMVEVTLFQDRGPYHPDGTWDPGDGVIEMVLSGPDVVGLTLNGPDPTPVPLPPGGSTDTSIPAKGWVRLLSYGWKGRQEFIELLDRVDFDVEP